MATHRDLQFSRRSTVRRVLRFRNPDGSPQDLTGCSLIWHVVPVDATPFDIISSGDPRITIDSPTAGRATLYASQPVVAAFTWDVSTFWLELIDAIGDHSIRAEGRMLIEP